MTCYLSAIFHSFSQVPAQSNLFRTLPSNFNFKTKFHSSDILEIAGSPHHTNGKLQKYLEKINEKETPHNKSSDWEPKVQKCNYPCELINDSSFNSHEESLHMNTKSLFKKKKNARLQKIYPILVPPRGLGVLPHSQHWRVTPLPAGACSKPTAQHHTWGFFTFFFTFYTFLHLFSFYLTQVELLFESSLSEKILYYGNKLVKTNRKQKINFTGSQLPVLQMFKEILSIL